MLVAPAFAQAAPADGGSGFLVQLLPLVLIFAVFYFLLIRPQQRRLKAHKAMVAAIGRGDRVVTAGGVMGRVARLEDDGRTVSVEIARDVRVRIVRDTISEVVKPEEAEEKRAPAAPAPKAPKAS